MRTWQSVALVATGVGLLSACGFIPTRSTPPPRPAPPVVRSVPSGLTLSKQFLEFEAAALNESAPTQNITLRNPTDHAVILSRISVVQSSTDFDTANDCGTELPPGQACTIKVSFRRQRSSGRSGTLYVYFDPGSPVPLENLHAALFANALP